MSRHPAPEGYDARAPITVMVTRAQQVQLELHLAQARETHPTADDNAITDLIFSRGLAAVMEKPMESITQQHTAAVSKADIEADPLAQTVGGRFLQLGIGRNLADLLTRTHKACREKSPDYAEDSLLRHALECGLCDIAAGIRDLQEYPQTEPDDALTTTADADITPPGFVRHALHIPLELHPATQDLVRNFAEALANKLLDAQVKTGQTDDWRRVNVLELQAELMKHVAKGDPRDVAAYCAFLWHINQPTAHVGYISQAKHEAGIERTKEESQAIIERQAGVIRGMAEGARAAGAQMRADVEHWRGDIERLTDQLEAARCRSVQAAITVLHAAMADTAASLTIDQHAHPEIVYGSGLDGVRVPAAEVAQVIESLETLAQYTADRAPATQRAEG